MTRRAELASVFLARCGSRAAFLGLVVVLVLTGVPTAVLAVDCNGNSILDADEVAMGADDCNLNGVPDECDVVPPDFRSMRSLGLGTTRAVFWEDVNGDGLSDLLAGTTGELSVWLASPGSGVVDSERLDLPLDGLLRSWVLGDVNGDGALDAVAHAGRELRLLLNDGTGRFAEETTVELGVVGGNSLVAGDFDGDGLADIGLSDILEDVVLFLWGGETSLAEERHVVGDFPIGLSAADVDADGSTDLVVLNRDSDTVSLLYSSGDRRFETRTLTVVEDDPDDDRPEQLCVTDLDADGLPDLATSHWGATAVILNQGGRNFAEPAFFAHDVRRPSTLIAADANSDGAIDLLAPGGSGIGVDVFWNRGDGHLQARSVVALEETVTAMRVADIDADEFPDLVVGLSGQSGVVVLAHGRFSGTVRAAFAPGVTYPALPATRNVEPHGLTLGDYDGDGWPDVGSVNGGAGTLTVLWNDGAGELEGGGFETSSGFGRLDTADTGDLDGDQDLDIVIAGRSDARIGVVVNEGERRFERATQVPSGGDISMLQLADVDRDGTLDIVSAHPSNHRVSVHFGSGDATFEPALVLSSGRGPRAVVAGDFDVDGDLDLASADSTGSSLTVFTNRGARELQVSGEILLARSPFFIATADFDRDGSPDLAANNADGGVDFLFGKGDGGFLEPLAFAGREQAFSLLAVDVTVDGLPDVVTANERAGTLSLVLGAGERSFTTGPRISRTDGVRIVDAADMDRDGAVDLVSGNRGGRNVSVILNQIGALLTTEPYEGAICTPLDFRRLGIPPATRSNAELLVLYVSPVEQEEGFPPVLYHDTERFPLHREFLAEIFPERFADLEPQQYLALTGRRATRAVFVGSLLRFRTDDGIVYGFDVFVDESQAGELLGPEEIGAVRARLAESFTLEPLVYAPQRTAARDAASEWNAPGFPVYIAPEAPPMPEPPEELPTPTFALEIPADTETCGVFAPAGALRGLDDEYELKTTVRFRSGMVSLPTEDDSFAQGIVDTLRFGPQQLVAESLGEGLFEVRRLPLGGGVTGYRFTYAEAFLLPTGEMLEFVLAAPLILRARGEEILDEPVVLGDDFFTVNAGDESFQASLDGNPLLRYGSCTYRSLPFFEITAELDGGSRLRLEERFLEAGSLLETGPASLVRATLEGTDEVRVVADYWRLVYSAARHNRWAQYRVFLETPMRFAEAEAPVHVVEVSAPESFDRSTAEVRLLGEALEHLASPRIVSYTKTEKAVAGDVPFQRGDVNADGRWNLTDAVALLHFGFGRGEAPVCVKSADVNDDGRVNLLDAVSLLDFVFRRGEAPADPFESCGVDPTEDGLDCAAVPPCRE